MIQRGKDYLRKHPDSQFIHAIGDQAIDQVTDSFAKFSGKTNPLRHTLIHCQITSLDMLQRISENNICVQVQPIFLDYDVNIVQDRVGKAKAQTSYVFNTLYNDLNVHTSYGTDAPVIDLNPFRSIYSAVTRKPLKRPEADSFNSRECVTIEDAIDCYTLESAYGTFMEDKIGRIKQGYYADFIVLDRDIFTIASEEIKDVTVEKTFINSQCVFEK